jgi:hypothetical protein
MPDKPPEPTGQPTEKVIAKLFSKKAVARMKAMAHEKDSVFLKLLAPKPGDEMLSDSWDEDSPKP